MGNQTAKLNRKLDNLLKTVYGYWFKEEELSEISIDIVSVNDEIINESIIEDINDQNKNDFKEDNLDSISIKSNQLESIICTSITKEEYKQDKRKAQQILNSDHKKKKKLCIDKENIEHF